MSSASLSGRPEGCLSPKEFAERAGISLSTVHRYLKNGHLPKVQRAGKNGRVWIPEQELYTVSGPQMDDTSTCEVADLLPDSLNSANCLPGRRPGWMSGLHS